MLQVVVARVMLVDPVAEGMSEPIKGKNGDGSCVSVRSDRK